MSKEMAREIAERIINKIDVAELFAEQYKDNKRENPFNSERIGMEEMLKLMGVEFEYGFNENYEVASVTVAGVTVAR